MRSTLLPSLLVCVCALGCVSASRLDADAYRQQPLRSARKLLHADQLLETLQPLADQTPGIEIAARQNLFNYATQQGLEILKGKIQDLAIPDIAKTFNLPLVGEFTLQLYNIRITQFNVSSQEARLTIMDERFELWVTQVDVQLLFSWHWEKLGMQGTGDGELDLHGGSIDYQFRVTTTDDGKPHVAVDDASSKFSSVELKIKSYSADWLYQAVMSLFNEQIQHAVQNGIANALHADVPDAVNHVLDTLPTRLDVTGLPFSTTFEYSIFTLTYVIVKGYGEIESDTSLGIRAMSPCPFAASPLPLTVDDIGADGHMTSIYLHESVANCMLWGLHRSNALKYRIADGSIPKLHLTTDLLAMLIPQLPKAYPHQSLIIDIEATSAPLVSFTQDAGTTLKATYTTSIYVVNETLNNPKIVTLSAELTIQGQFNYDSTIITLAKAQHTVDEANLPVSAPQWDNTVAWFIQNYAGLYPLQFLIEHFVQTPVTSLVSLVDAEAQTFPGWYALSGDVMVHPDLTSRTKSKA